MRHKKKGRKLGRKVGNRRALLMNLASQMITHKRIKTTDSKAKELRTYIEPLITLAKKDDLHSRRMIIRKLPKKDIVKTLYDEIAPLYVDRPGGYTRIVKLGYRDNDRAPVSIIEFVDMVDVSTSEEKETDAS
ncbi:MAG: 50S ribosomal protein L17 [Candidatus Neomarinimicrobiota bacterium]|uniref:50S ribosomal protein L17 n=1 Tax=marine metagenome TaxID=408172 RepID=A0A381QEF8_9ZZZZ|nr:50S ribosomal protein L17 [Candidatus Neomarinimicrobiota bacterium]MED5554110.1 50S ribosomal protein L17 [Candidatus Neomarinimicrobiota bacterium]|tara:strand:- start:750 stop:1148 length:399 start_codon:yes stop_codon:yes gene_type:complete